MCSALTVALRNQCSLWIFIIRCRLTSQNCRLLLFWSSTFSYDSHPLSTEKGYPNLEPSRTALAGIIVFQMTNLLISIWEAEIGIKLQLRPTWFYFIFQTKCSFSTVSPKSLFITIESELYGTLLFYSNWMTCWLMKAVITALHPSWTKLLETLSPFFSSV